MGLCRRGGGGHTSLRLRRGLSPPHGGTRHDGRGNWSRLYLHASLCGHLLANSSDVLPKLVGVKLTVSYLSFWLVYSVGSGMLTGWIL
jgi:hypothetical protein